MLKEGQKKINNYLIRQLPQATVFVNKQKTIVYASDRWISDFQLDNSQVIGKNILTLFTNVNTEWQKIISHSLKALPYLTLTESYLDKHKNKKWFQIISAPWHDENENITGTILQAEDVTQRILSETKLEKLEIISEDISDIAEIGFWDYNLADDKMFWDTRTKMIHELPENYSPNFSDALNFYKLGNSRNTISMIINKAITQEIPFSEKLELITAKGNEIWVTVSGKPLYKNKRFTGMVGTIQNINERHIIEEKTKENERLLRTLIDNLPLNVSIKDLESRKILVNKSAKEFYNVSTDEEIIGKDNSSFFSKSAAAVSKKEDLAVMRDLKPILKKEQNFKGPNGHKGTYLISKIPLIDTDDHAYGLVSIRLDISDLKKKEVELRKLIDVTSLQNEKLINFAHIVSHNLRSHSANFSMLLDFLYTENSKTERDKIMKMLFKSSNNLLTTLDNLNEVVEINKNTNLTIKSLSVNKKIISTEQNLDQFLKQHKVKIINTIDDDFRIKSVPAYLDSILTNFITNGIKYRSPNRDSFIKFSATSTKGFSVITITDNGVGIDLNKYGNKLFGMYKTFHNNKDSRGIGLYISKNQIEAMKGKITVKSKVDQGTTFKIYFNEKH